jgi:hypothetical protein
MNALPIQHVVNMRTYDPKYAHYYSNGSGRDQFIAYNNGGFSIPRIPNPSQATAFMRLGSASLGAYHST